MATKKSKTGFGTSRVLKAPKLNPNFAITPDVNIKNKSVSVLSSELETLLDIREQIIPFFTNQQTTRDSNPN